MVIIDASVAYKWLDRNEKDYRQAQILLKNHVSGQNVILAPTIIIFELANVWATKSSITKSMIQKNNSKLFSYRLNIVSPDEGLVHAFTLFAKEYSVSAYDASYAVLAQQNNCELITADEKFVKQVNLPFVKLLKDYL